MSEPVDKPVHSRCQRCGRWGDLCRCGDPYVPVPVAPDAARDARVAARRAADARAAGHALDQLIAGEGPIGPGAYKIGWSDGYAAAQLHHSGHYDVPLRVTAPTDWDREPAHPAGNCGPINLPLAPGSRCPTCGELIPS